MAAGKRGNACGAVCGGVRRCITYTTTQLKGEMPITTHRAHLPVVQAGSGRGGGVCVGGRGSGRCAAAPLARSPNPPAPPSCRGTHHSPALTEVAAACTSSWVGLRGGRGQSVCSTNASAGVPRRSQTKARIVAISRGGGGRADGRRCGNRVQARRGGGCTSRADRVDCEDRLAPCVSPELGWVCKLDGAQQGAGARQSAARVHAALGRGGM